MPQKTYTKDNKVKKGGSVELIFNPERRFQSKFNSIMATSPANTIGPSSQSPLRGSPPRTSVCHRPKLMRSSATAPCVATSNASRNDMVSLSRASTLLNRVALYSLTRQEHEHRVRPASDRYKTAGPRERSLSPHRHRSDRQLGERGETIYAGAIFHGQYPSLGCGKTGGTKYIRAGRGGVFQFPKL
jgi:hypothetical protein